MRDAGCKGEVPDDPPDILVLAHGSRKLVKGRVKVICCRATFTLETIVVYLVPL